MLQERRELGKAALEQFGEIICARVIDSDWYQHAKVIHCFHGVPGMGEVATRRLLEHVLSSGRTLVMPRVINPLGEMEHASVRDLDKLVPGAWGIPEPAGTELIAASQIELVIAPGLAADPAGNRLGYGKGFYDRFFAQASNALKVMLVPSRFIVEKIPAADHDVPVDKLVTESGVLDCRS